MTASQKGVAEDATKLKNNSKLHNNCSESSHRSTILNNLNFKGRGETLDPRESANILK